MKFGYCLGILDFNLIKILLYKGLFQLLRTTKYIDILSSFLDFIL